MSAPDTNTKKQEKEHRPALFGIGAAIAVGALMLMAILFAAFDTEEPDAGPQTVNEAVPQETPQSQAPAGEE